MKGVRKAATRTEQQQQRARSVQVMASTKTSVSAMADILGISVAELRKEYRVELNNGHEFVYAAISQRLVKAALGGDVRSMLAWMRQFGGWQEITRREITGKNGEPLSFTSLDTASLATLIDTLAAPGAFGRSASRNGKETDVRTIDVDDLDAISGSSNEGDE